LSKLASGCMSHRRTTNDRSFSSSRHGAL